MKKYTIQAGDTLGSIAKKIYKDPMKYKEIAEANHIANPNVISVGQELILPGIEDEGIVVPKVVTESRDVSDSSSKGILTVDSLRSIMPKASEKNILKYLEPLNTQMVKFEINSPLRVAHFIAQLAHESGSFQYSSENLNYSDKALRAVFGRYFPTEELANEYARQPEKIANRVYANRMANGNEVSGDGWKYRGRGLIQLTGRDNYTQCGAALKLDLVDQPNQLAEDPQIAVDAAAWFWDMRYLNTYADQDDIKSITKRINGGYNGLEDREAYLARAKAALNIHATSVR